jgi:hypothetical protein
VWSNFPEGAACEKDEDLTYAGQEPRAMLRGAHHHIIMHMRSVNATSTDATATTSIIIQIQIKYITLSYENTSLSILSEEQNENNYHQGF